MKFVAILRLVAVAVTQECPHNFQLMCIDGINKAYPICGNAAQEKVKDSADLDCMKYFTKMDVDCWPCICIVANEMSWKIMGCE